MGLEKILCSSIANNLLIISHASEKETQGFSGWLFTNGKSNKIHF